MRLLTRREADPSLAVERLAAPRLAVPRGWLESAPAPVWALAGMVVVYVIVFGTLTWRHQSNFGTFGFDMGIFDQGIWLLSRFREPFVTVRGLNYFGNHVNVTTLLFVPFYWLGAGPHFLYLVQTAAIGLGAVPIWLLARDRLGNQWLALGLPAAFLLYPSLEWINWWHFHPDTLALTPLLFAYWLATRGRWRAYAVAVGLCLLTKEDTSFAVLALGLVVAVRHSRRAGLWTAGAAAAWLVLCVRVIIPHANGGLGPFYQELFPGFGNSVGAIAFNMVRHPSRILHLSTEAHRLTYYRQLLAPVGFTALLSPLTLFIGVPNALINVSSVQPYTYQIQYQYSTLVAGAALLAAVEGVALVRQMPLRRFLVGLVCATALATNVAWSPSPLGVKYHSGVWAVHAQPRQRAIDAALALVPRDARVSATYYLVPHLTHRVHVYEFPNPFRAANWGVDGSGPPRPRDADYVVVDLTLLGDSKPVYDRLSGPGGDFDVLFRHNGIAVLRRAGAR